MVSSIDQKTFMRSCMKSILPVVFLFLFFASYAALSKEGKDLIKIKSRRQVTDSTANPQSDTLRWNAVRFTDLNNNQSTDKTCQFVTYGKDKVDWIQKNGSLVYSFTVESTTDGGWVDANADGSITYNVGLNHMSGTLTIARNAGTINVVLKLAGGADKISLQYDITDFDIL